MIVEWHANIIIRNKCFHHHHHHRVGHTAASAQTGRKKKCQRVRERERREKEKKLSEMWNLWKFNLCDCETSTESGWECQWCKKPAKIVLYVFFRYCIYMKDESWIDEWWEKVGRRKNDNWFWCCCWLDVKKILNWRIKFRCHQRFECHSAPSIMYMLSIYTQFR